MKYTAALFALPLASAFGLSPRHEGHDHDSSSEHSNDTSGTGHDHSMAHGQFNFTPSGIPWPTCARTCCNANFQYFSKPVNHPLCGAYAVVAEIECPQAEDYEVDIDKDAVVSALKKEGGNPQSCSGVNNETIECQNETTEGRGALAYGQGDLLIPTFTVAGLAILLSLGL
ncbi:Hypothetical protein NCS54_01212400 [Fusarium falciforme]|uniref:Hypothetical protein n=1 Tax=Fusarium falciforme TaxID=195108 RepID=UPI002301FB65|nr:Hypothetical protein NCS54_01212400 [Fusarium falciforme]WAO94536.1 Hypothetical protein NCS54_01212400 [Fusarium falciforme]